MDTKPNLKQLRQKYLWSRENLPAFDFVHFLRQDVFPVIFEEKKFITYVHPIIYWDKDKYATEAFFELLSDFVLEAALLAVELKKSIPTEGYRLKSCFKAYEENYPTAVLSHPFVPPQKAFNANFKRQYKYSKAWVAEILKYIHLIEVYVLNRFKTYDTLDERREWPKSCLLQVCCFLEALDEKQQHEKEIDYLFKLYRDISEFLDKDYPDNYELYLQFYTFYLSDKPFHNPTFQAQKSYFPPFQKDIKILERDFLALLDDLEANIEQIKELTCVGGNLKYGKEIITNLTAIEVSFCKKMFAHPQKAKIETINVEEAVYGQPLADQGSRLKIAISRLNKKIEQHFGLKRVFSYGKDFTTRNV